MVVLSILVAISALVLQFLNTVYNPVTLTFFVVTFILVTMKNKSMTLVPSISYLITTIIAMVIFSKNPDEAMAVEVIMNFAYIYVFVFVYICSIIISMARISAYGNDAYLKKLDKADSNISYFMLVNAAVCVGVIIVSIYYNGKTDPSIWQFTALCIFTIIILSIITRMEGTMIINDERRKIMELIKASEESSDEGKANDETGDGESGESKTDNGTEVLPAKTDGIKL